MKKLEILRAITEMIGMNILTSAEGYRLIEKVINITKYGTNKNVPKEAEKVLENKPTKEDILAREEAVAREEAIDKEIKQEDKDYELFL